MIDFRSTRETRASSFDYIQVRIASPEEMRGPKDPKERERLEMSGLRTWWRRRSLCPDVKLRPAARDGHGQGAA